jgi:hypothetical protein
MRVHAVARRPRSFKVVTQQLSNQLKKHGVVFIWTGHQVENMFIFILQAWIQITAKLTRPPFVIYSAQKEQVLSGLRLTPEEYGGSLEVRI